MNKKKKNAGAKQLRTASCTEQIPDFIKAGMEQKMSSLEIAEISGKNHKDVMRAIRSMEPAWVKVNGRNFALVEYRDKKGELRPCYELNKFECLYIATKFNDEARAKLVLRWAELEAFVEKQSRIELEEAREKVEYFDDAMSGNSSFPVRIIAHTLGMTAQELNKFLCEQRIQYGQSGSYVPYAPFAKKGFTKSRTFNRHHKDGSVTTEHRTTWTEPGICFIVNCVKEERRKALPKPKFIQLTLKFI